MIAGGAGIYAFLGGEGIWYFEDWIFFSTKFDNKIHGIDIVNQTHTLLYEANPDDVAAGTAVLSGVDNLTVDEGSQEHSKAGRLDAYIRVYHG